MTYDAHVLAVHATEGWSMDVSYGGFEERPQENDLRGRAAEAFTRFFGVEASSVAVEVTEVGD
jgi:hypothetical protein